MTTLLVLTLVALFATALCASPSCVPSYGNIPNPSPSPDNPSPEKYSVVFNTSVLIDGKQADPIVIEVTRSWAPIGADRFYSLVKDGYYNCAAYFRVVPDFVVQFGIAAEPSETSKWDTVIPDDPVLESNRQWTVTYATAGPDTRTTQLFINYVDNAQLDSQGFAPFAVVTGGFDTASAIYNPTPENSNGINQGLYTKLGNEWLLEKYPDTTIITSASLSNTVLSVL